MRMFKVFEIKLLNQSEPSQCRQNVSNNDIPHPAPHLSQRGGSSLSSEGGSTDFGTVISFGLDAMTCASLTASSSAIPSTCAFRKRSIPFLTVFISSTISFCSATLDCFFFRTFFFLSDTVSFAPVFLFLVFLCLMLRDPSSISSEEGSVKKI